MIIECKKPSLILEGPGDKAAVPRLIREIYYMNEIYDINTAPHPKTGVEISKLKRMGELERYVEYASRGSCDSVLLILDCEDYCPIEVATEFCSRIGAMRIDKKVGISFLKAEFESLFIHCLHSISERYKEYNWKTNQIDLEFDIESCRDAKGFLSRLMSNDRAYKETRDQEKFITGLDYDVLREKSRSFRHLENTLLWLAGRRNVGDTIYPALYS